MADEVKEEVVEEVKDICPCNGCFKDVMTIDEIAAYLQVGKTVIAKLVKEDAIPFKRIGSRLRFSREAVSEWVYEGANDGGSEETEE